MTTKSSQKRKYLENEKSFLDEKKNIFHNSEMAFNEANNTIFLEGESPTLRCAYNLMNSSI